MARLADVYVLVGILILALVGLAAVLVAFRRHESHATSRLSADVDSWSVSRSLAQTDLALFRADLATKPASLEELADLGDPLVEELQDDLSTLQSGCEAMTRQLAEADDPAHVQAVTALLYEGRRGLAELTARISDEPVAAAKSPCFFNPNHGPSVTVVGWTTAANRPVRVPSCAADAERLRSGASPYSRTVTVNGVRVPWWEAGTRVRPWALGWFGGWLKDSGAKDVASSFLALADAPAAGEHRARRAS